MDIISIIVGSIEAITAVAVTSFGASIFSNFFGREKGMADAENAAAAQEERASDDEVLKNTTDENEFTDLERKAGDSGQEKSEDEAEKADAEGEDKDSDSDKDSDGKRGVFVAAVPVGGKDKDEDEDEEDEKSEDEAEKADAEGEDKDSDSDKDSDGKKGGVFVAAVPVGGKDKDEDEDEDEEEDPEEPHVPVIVDHINAIEADELMSDELALALVVEEDEDEQTAEEQIELNAEGAFVEGSDIDIQKDVVASGDAEHTMSAATSHPKTEGQKGHINLGDVDAAFEAGDTVTLDILKQKGLVPKKIKRIKILADGELTKPLTVKAHSFSIQAIKMIELTGGMVIKLR